MSGIALPFAIAIFNGRVPYVGYSPLVGDAIGPPRCFRAHFDNSGKAYCLHCAVAHGIFIFQMAAQTDIMPLRVRQSLLGE